MSEGDRPGGERRRAGSDLDPDGQEEAGRAKRGRARARTRISATAPTAGPSSSLLPPHISQISTRGASPLQIIEGLSIRGHGGSSGSSPGEGSGGSATGEGPGGANGNEGGDGNGREGNGGGNGSGGRRASRLGPRAEVNIAVAYDVVNSKDGHQKVGSAGQRVPLLANFYDVIRKDTWCLFHYRVDFEPETDRVGLKKALLRDHNDKLPAYTFDGFSLHTPAQLGQEFLELTSTNRRDQSSVKIQLRLVGQLDKTDPMYLQFYNIMIRKCLGLLKLALLGKNYFDQNLAIQLPNHRLQIWPGFLTTMRQHDKGLLYGVQVLHKVIRTDTVWDMFCSKKREVQERGGGGMERVKEAVRAELVGTIVITHHNSKTYKIDDIAWNEKPTSTFKVKDQDKTYVDYYREKYDYTVQQMMQPLLISNPTKEDIRRGKTEPVKLLPEMCNITGLSEAMRQNFNLMRDMGQYLFQGPDKKVETMNKFVKRIRTTPEVKKELESWGLDISDKMVQVPGRVLAPEQIQFKDQRMDNPKSFEVNAQTGDFTVAFRSARLTRGIPLKVWVCIVPARDAQNVDNLIQTMQTVSRPLEFNVARPAEIIKLNNTHIDGYIDAINSSIQKYQKDLQMIFTILPNNKLEVYSAIKKRCYVDYGISSQCFLSRNVTAKGLMSIATKLTVQMNCKLGGEAWGVVIPLKKMMVVGFDVYHGAPGSRGGSIGAMVATISPSYGRYFSTVSIFPTREEVTANMGSELTKCIEAWKRHNDGQLPERIMFYRDGVGEGQLQFVFAEELEAMKKLINGIYNDEGVPQPKLTFIVVTKRINARFFKAGGGAPSNPIPGTVIDDVVTLPERYDFYLIAQAVRQGTVSPTSYNVIFDRSGLDADKIQRLTYKLCHMYYNFSGTVSVPAPCQYAHKLAYLTGLATKSVNNPKLSNHLYFL